MQVHHVPTQFARRPKRSIIEPLEGRTLLSTYTVMNLNDAGPGSLRDEIGRANSSAGADTIRFAPGLSGTIALTGGTLSISDGLDLAGPGANIVSVSGMNVATVFHVGDGSVTMSGLTISDGYSKQPGLGAGGGIVNEGHLTLNACALTHNQGVSAGAIGNDRAGILDITNCTFSGNSAPGDAAIFGGSGTVNITHTIFSGNTGGGIISNEYGMVTMIDSTIAGNSTYVGIKDGEGDFTIVNTTISGIAGEGGAINNYCSIHLTLVNCTLTDNGFGVYDYMGFLTITHCTITGNGVGLQAESMTAGEARVTLDNSIVAKNDSDLVITHQADNVVGSNNLIGTGGSGGLMDGKDGNHVGVADPMLAPLGDYGGPTQTMPPLPGSPAIDHGSNALAVGPDGKPLATDQRGYARVFNGTVDIGADEFGFAPASPVVTNLNDSGPGSLRQAVLLTNINFGPDTITFSPGLSGTIKLTSGDITFTDKLTIAGPGRSVLTISGGGLMGDPYDFPRQPSLTVSGLSLADTTLSDDVTPITLVDCVFTHSSITTILSDLVIRGCTITDNAAIMPYVLDASDSTFSHSVIASPSLAAGAYSFTDCTITGSQGDGIDISGEGVTLTRCTVSNNAGYGISDYEETVQLIDSTVSGNGRGGLGGGDAGAGGGAGFLISGSTVANNKGPGITYIGGLTVVNSTLVNNMGGGIDGNGGLVVTNSTIVDNVGKVGGITASDLETSSSWIINNSIITGNHDANGGASDLSFSSQRAGGGFTGSNNLIGTDRSGAFVNGQNGNVVGVADPMLAPLGDYGGPTQTMPPLAGSPAIDAGNNAIAVGPDVAGPNSKPLIADQRGYYRIVNGKVDIGAVEFNSTPVLVGDANGDRKVDFADLLVLAQNYGKTGTSWDQGDFNDDGKIDFADLLSLSQNFGKSSRFPTVATRKRAHS